ncbi:hypothetical protein QA584_12565 [Anaerocolumna sp. AGMB13025]|uniref:hypothetical protein n=1 Tax=Anaerocolumna sp. AGMB13025 TaxID=3039116 RepID=UPI00241E2982|nr:hypothetical protein [Anaerocolumna sp. AGMB13025]WFR59872.1 hypothetical protein QA584_12565 [Anaerocolumna sp. AGMB13025]
MDLKSNKLNLRRLNLSAWLMVLFTYLLPYRYADGFETTFGYPIPYITIHDIPIERTPFMSMNINVLAFLINIFIIYIIISLATKLWKRLSKKISN